MKLYNRKTPRAQRYDYRSAWMYFITICTKNRQHYFGEIRRDGISDRPTMILSDIGKICEKELHIMLQKRPSIDIHAYVIMPDHIHLLFWMDNRRDMGLPCPNNINNNNINVPHSYNEDRTPQADVPTSNITNQTLSSVIGWRKSAVSKSAKNNHFPFARQPRYHDRIIRTEKEYNNVLRYIQLNPEKRHINNK